ncbi:MAG: hypothetical protein H6673_12675 [Anaerolineales bacterium]|nr:hypothetical protein [Anaerolineales bacterium]
METLLLITEVTTMRDGRVCIAGVDRTYKAIRPVLPHHIYKRHLYLSTGQAIYPRAVISLDLTPEDDLDRPHLEDCRWDTTQPTTFERETSPDNWKRVLTETAATSIEDLFGTEVHRGENVAAGSGLRSLGTLVPERITNLWHKSHDQRQHQYRLEFYDSTGQQFDIPINDLTVQTYIQRLQHNGFKMDYIETLLVDRFNRGEVYLRLGLTRPWNGWCWLQVTGVYTFPDYLAGKNFTEIELFSEDPTPN